MAKRSSRQRRFDSDEEDSRVFQSPVQMSDDSDIPQDKSRQVVGNLQQRNASSVDLPSTEGQAPTTVTPISFREHSPVSVSLKSVTRHNRSSHPINESSEATPLLPPCSADSGIVKDDQLHCMSAVLKPAKPAHPKKALSSKRRRCPRHVQYCCMCILSFSASLLVLSVLAAVIIPVEIRKLKNHTSDVIIRNENDTIIAVQVNSKYTNKISLQLVHEGSQPLHIIHLYSTPCDKLTTHSRPAMTHSSASIPIDGAIKIMFPTYLATGSRINIDSYVLNASKLTVEIELYIFRSLKMVDNFATNLDKRVFQGTIYISGPGVQNTSTFINYTIPTTEYYFVVVDATDPIVAQFDKTVHMEVFKGTDYKEACVIEGSDNCVVKYGDSTPFHDKQECILAQAEYERDLPWAEANIQVTHYPRRITVTALTVMSSVGGICFVLLSITIFSGFYCLYKCVGVYKHIHS